MRSALEPDVCVDMELRRGYALQHEAIPTRAELRGVHNPGARARNRDRYRHVHR